MYMYIYDILTLYCNSLSLLACLWLVLAVLGDEQPLFPSLFSTFLVPAEAPPLFSLEKKKTIKKQNIQHTCSYTL